jgi:hypothetical protein
MSPKSAAPKHVIVDGSNIATEGRSKPSLKQLNEAVMAFIGDHPKAVITVIVDATLAIALIRKKWQLLIKQSNTTNS